MTQQASSQRTETDSHAPKGRLGLFAGAGIELEYMIVDRETLDVRPIADRLLMDAITDRTLSLGEVEREEGSDVPSEIEIRGIAGESLAHRISWSNELTLHVIELKSSSPVRRVTPELAQDFTAHIRAINRLLARHGAMLMGGGMHPWMDPNREKVLWPHGRREIYEAFDRIFDCRGHGWANLQSMHINLPFADDEEFGRLHAAIRVLLPIMPALSAASPIMDGRATGKLDNRLAVYKANARKVLSVSGRVIPEPAFTRAEYDETIFRTIYRDIAGHERSAGVEEGLLQHEWLNARGAIARFDRNAIEIRVLDVQETPNADIRIATTIIETLRALVEGRWSSQWRQREWGVEPLAKLLDAVIDSGGGASLDLAPGYAELFPASVRGARTVAELWSGIVADLRSGGWLTEGSIAAQPSLAERMWVRVNANRVPRSGVDGEVPRAELKACAAELCACLNEGRLLDG